METQVTLGILAGGHGTRLGGRDKAWLQRDGEPQVLRLARHFGAACSATLVSANANATRLADAGLKVVPDRIVDVGPLGGLEALAAACVTPWLFTMPVDTVDASDCLLRTLLGAGHDGAVAEDDDGLQPLVAVYRVDVLREGVSRAILAGDHSVRAMQARLQLPRVRFAGLRFGNLNTPADLLAAGFDP